MIIGVPRETHPGERRVSLVPAAVSRLGKAGLQVAIESGAGDAAGFPDAAYAAKGARVLADRGELLRGAGVLAQVRTPPASAEGWRDDLPRLQQGQILLGFAEPWTAAAPIRLLAARGVTLLAMELMPRITRAQSMDALSSMANLAGYKAVLLAASELPRIFPMLMTAAGTLKPAHVLVLGAGVAGLQAIATARRLGAVVSGYDIRPAAREQIRSLGARSVEIPLEPAAGEASGGYAREQSGEQQRRLQELLARTVAASDVVITTAAVPGKRAPVLLTTSMLEKMAPGSVVVDLAAERGGNCEKTQPGRTIEHGGVRILGPRNLPSTVPHDASLMYSGNVAALLLHLVQDGEIDLARDDEILRATMVLREGSLVHEAVRGALEELEPLEKREPIDGEPERKPEEQP